MYCEQSGGDVLSARARRVLQVRAYQQLAALQGKCIPVLEAAGLLGLHEVVVAVSGGQRITPGDDATADDSHRLRWDALDSLRRIHDCGVLHGNVETRNLFVQQSPEVGFRQVVSCFVHAVVGSGRHLMDLDNMPWAIPVATPDVRR